MHKKTSLALSIALLLCLFGGCGHSGSEKKILRYDIAATVTNLDPQFAMDPAARMILHNICEGLVVREPDGTLIPGAAQLYTISPDDKTYTFHLKKEAMWAGKEPTPVTADDFVFAFRRMFTAGSASPYAEDYILIENAAEVMAGTLPVTSLSVKAVDEHTLTITLTQPSPLFLELLSDTAAMPCREAAFQEARGRYGLERQYVGANGPFTVEGWTETQISLRGNSGYVSDRETAAGGVNLYIAKENPAERFLEGNTDIAALSLSQAEKAKDAGLALQSVEKITWCLVFNQNHQIWGNPLLRQGLAHAVEYGYFAEHLEKNLLPTSVLLPPATLLLDKPFREYGQAESPLAFDEEAARRLYAMGLEALNLESLPGTELYVPDSDNHALYMGLVQQCWQKTLSAYISIRQEPAAELERRLAQGGYDILLMPFSGEHYRIEDLLSIFMSTSSENRFGYHNPRYDELLRQALGQTSLEQAAFRFSQAERTLLSDAVVIPLYTETSYYAMGSGVEGIEITPFGDRFYFRHGIRP